MPEKLAKEIHNDHSYYRHPDEPESLLTGGEYLDIMMERDGPWGIMLMQADGKPGNSTYKYRSPDELTAKGRAKIGRQSPEFNYSLSDMGIFEWLALTLQEDLNKLADGSTSMLLANRIDYDDGARVPAPSVTSEGKITYYLMPANSPPASPITNVRYCIGSPKVGTL